MKNEIISVENTAWSLQDNGHKTLILENISFSLQQGEFLTILGPQNSGKSTLLKIIAGLEEPGEGRVVFHSGKNLSYIPSEPSSLPWLNVKQNLVYFLKISGKNADNDEIQKIIDLVGLSGYEEHFPDNRSIGFRFRISLACALVLKPLAMLIDEPFNSLDNLTKQEILFLLRKVKNENNLTILFSTSNISEAVFLSDRILLFRKNPSSISGAINIDLPGERQLDIFSLPLFFDLLKKIESEIKPDPDQALNSFLI